MLFRSIISSFQCCQLKFYIKLGACVEGGAIFKQKNAGDVLLSHSVPLQYHRR